MSEIGTSAEAAQQYVQTVPARQGKSMRDVPFEPHEIVRIGCIGLGGRGYDQLRNLLAIEGTQITALCDTDESHALRARTRVEEGGQPPPAIEPDADRLCARDDVDLVYICTPWDHHTPQAVRAMECGKHAAVEVPAATTLADCWRLVDTSERTRRHCVMLENCLYE